MHQCVVVVWIVLNEQSRSSVNQPAEEEHVAVTLVAID